MRASTRPGDGSERDSTSLRWRLSVPISLLFCSGEGLVSIPQVTDLDMRGPWVLQRFSTLPAGNAKYGGTPSWDSVRVTPEGFTGVHGGVRWRGLVFAGFLSLFAGMPTSTGPSWARKTKRPYRNYLVN